jgi:hypothetical protein
MKNPNISRSMAHGIAACAVASLTLAWSAQAQVQVANSFTMPVGIKAAVALSGCNNSPGPQITLSGAVTLGGLKANMIFRNNAIGTHTLVIQNVVAAVAVPAGDTIVIPKQPVLGGVGGNPWIWVQMMDDTDAPLTSQVFLGRCVQGPFNVDAAVSAEVTLAATFTATDCANNPGPYIYMDGAMNFAHGLKARFTFANADNPVGGPHEAVATTDVTLISRGFSVQFPKQPVLGGVGGNPWISVQFEQADGTAIGNEDLLGRCVQLARGN